jgi:hypothetical protein
MASKRKNKVDPNILWDQDEVLIALKERYFKLLPKEEFGKTSQLTATIDKLEVAINKRKEEVVSEHSQLYL